MYIRVGNRKLWSFKKKCLFFLNWGALKHRRVRLSTMNHCLALHFDWLKIRKASTPVLPKKCHGLGYSLQKIASNETAKFQNSPPLIHNLNYPL